MEIAEITPSSDRLTEEQRAAVEVVTAADGGGRIADVVEARCPNAERDIPLHVVSWATDAPDEPKAGVAEASAKGEGGAEAGKGPPGRRGRQTPSARRQEIKGSRYPLLKNPEDLTEGQAAALEAIARSDKRLYRAISGRRPARRLQGGEPGRGARTLNSWLSWAWWCMIPARRAFQEGAQAQGRRRPSGRARHQQRE